MNRRTSPLAVRILPTPVLALVLTACNLLDTSCVAVGDTDIVWGRCTLSLCCQIAAANWRSFDPSVTYSVRSNVKADISVGIADRCDKPSVSSLTPVCVGTTSCKGQQIFDESINSTKYVMITARSDTTPWPWQKWVV